MCLQQDPVTGQFPNLIEQYGEMHTKDDKYVHESAAANHVRNYFSN